MQILKRIILIAILITVASISGCIDSGDSSNGQTDMDVVVSGTMEPALYRGDIVVVEKNPDNIQVGDIVVYNATWFQNKAVIHRVISIKNDSNGNTLFKLKGDNNNISDPEPIYRSQIISKVVNTENGPYVIPKIGYITLWLRGL